MNSKTIENVLFLSRTICKIPSELLRNEMKNVTQNMQNPKELLGLDYNAALKLLLWPFLQK